MRSTCSADARDLVGPRATEIAVVGEHAACPGGIFLVEKQLERLFGSDQIGGAHLSGERLPFAGQSLLLLHPFVGQLDAVLRVLRATEPQLLEAVAQFPRGHLGGAQLARNPVPLHLVAAHLPANALDLGLDSLELRLRLARVAGRVGGRGQNQHQ